MTTAEWLANRLQEDKENPKLDWKRAEGMDPRDKRAVGEPCRGSHTVDKNGRIKNAHMVMYRCTAKDCSIRLLYVPSVGSVGTSRKATPLEQLIEQGTEELAADAAEDAPPRSASTGASSKAKAKPKAQAKRQPTRPTTEAEGSEDELEIPAPEWDGDLETWQAYRDEMEEWLLTTSSANPASEAEETTSSAAVSWNEVFTAEGPRSTGHVVLGQAGAAAPKRQPRRG